MGTDGVTEAPKEGDLANGQYTEERFVDLLARCGHMPLEDIRDRLLISLDLYTNSTYLDDITFVLAKSVK